jgi:Putative zinc- or iron-chelating domain
MSQPFVPPDVVPAATPSDEPLGRNELEEALRFLNHNATQNRLTQADVTATLKALVETLVSRGVLPLAEYERRRQRALDVAARGLEEQPVVKFGEAVDKYGLTDLPEIDCASLIPLCKARCCTLTVYCSAQDLDERVVHWDYGRPYQIRKREDNYCVHSEPVTHRCGIYGQRPAICRTYDCRRDRRIWRDFERRIPTDES